MKFYRMELLEGLRSDCCNGKVYKNGVDPFLVIAVCGKCKLFCGYKK